MPVFAYYRIPETGEPGMSVIDAPSIDAAKALAMTAINSGELRAARFWDGYRMAEIRRPDRPANAGSATRIAPADDRGARMIAMKCLALGRHFNWIEGAGVRDDRSADGEAALFLNDERFRLIGRSGNGQR